MRVEHEVDTRSVDLAAVLYRMTNGRLARLWHRQVLLLTTRGRKSGIARTVPLQFFPDGKRMIVVAANIGYIVYGVLLMVWIIAIGWELIRLART